MVGGRWSVTGDSGVGVVQEELRQLQPPSSPRQLVELLQPGKCERNVCGEHAQGIEPSVNPGKTQVEGRQAPGLPGLTC